MPFLVRDATVEPAPVYNIPDVLGTKKVTATGRAKLRENQAVAKPVSELQGELDELLDQDWEAQAKRY